MNLTDADRIKFNVYTLVWSEILTRISDLGELTSEVSSGGGSSELKPISLNECLIKIESPLTVFLKSDDFSDVESAGSHIGLACFDVNINALQRRSPLVSDVLRSAKQSFESKISKWSYDQYLECIHHVAVSVSRMMFENSHYHDEDLLRTFFKPTYQWEKQKLSHPMQCRSQLNEIQINLTLEHDFSDFCAFLFLFLHEYTSHVYSEDNKYTGGFHDGWMMFSAATYLYSLYIGERNSITVECLECKQILGSDNYVLDRNQAYAFDYVKAVLSARSKQSELRIFEFTEDFYHWLDNKDYFWRMTYEMSQFQRLYPAKPKSWLSYFINFLNIEFNNGDKKELYRHIVDAESVQSTMNYLKTSTFIATTARSSPIVARIFDDL